LIKEGRQMEYGIRSSIASLDKVSYAEDKHALLTPDHLIDCSIGTNPFGFSNEVARSLKTLPLDIINLYPESSDDLKEAIADFWKGIIPLRRSQILLGHGSIELIYKVNKMFIEEKSTVLGYSPQFPDYINDARTLGGQYDCYLLDKENNFRFCPEKFIARLRKGINLVYIDNPNNPTGQVIALHDLEAIAHQADTLGIPMIIDEAYGDFLPASASAVSLLDRYNHLMILRSFSKGLGLAGIRGGYIVTSDRLAEQYTKISNPYEMSGIARYLAIASLRDRNFMEDCGPKLQMNKKRFMASLTRLNVLETDLSVPIMTISHPDAHVDLQELLRRHRILTVSGESFIGLDKSFVRLRIPKDIDALMDAFWLIEKEMEPCGSGKAKVGYEFEL
jgi:histidinol-phosphate aminotransferase